MKKILVIGATSAIAEATARRFAQRGDRLYLAGRREERLTAIAADLKTLGADDVGWMAFDANHTYQHTGLFDAATLAMGGMDTVLIAHGTLPQQADCAENVGKTLAEFQTNALSVIALCTELANRFEATGHGSMAVISSVAGDRGRQSNYVYGAAKGAVNLFLQGLRNRLAKAGVQVLTIKPGFVDTPMTASFKKGALWTTPDQIARGIVTALDRGHNEVYLPGFWRYIMLVIRHIPEPIFKRLSL